MSNQISELATLVGSRICHDLISPIGAIGNGLELMALTEEGKSGPEMSMTQQSCDSARARIRFFRVAFGSTGQSQSMRNTEVTTILRDVADGTRHRIHWSGPDAPDRRRVQMAFLASMCVETALPHGGDVFVEDQATVITVQGSGPRVVYNGELWDGLRGADMPNVTAAQVHFSLLSVLAKDAGIIVKASVTEDGVSMKLSDGIPAPV